MGGASLQEEASLSVKAGSNFRGVLIRRKEEEECQRNHMARTESVWLTSETKLNCGVSC